MDSARSRYQRRLVTAFLLFSAGILACLLLFQYHRETTLKAETLNARLQEYNRALIDALADSVTPRAFIDGHTPPVDGLRVSVIDADGEVVFDNTLDTLPSANHLERPEIAAALRDGTGYTVRRHSQSTGDTYFYSAMADGGTVVRTAVPYRLRVTDMLLPDRGFLWLMGAVVAIMGVFAWLVFYLLRDRDRQVSERMRIKRELTNNINHEIKTPVAAIQICTETLLRRPDLDEATRREIVEKCHANSRRLASLMTDVATLTRLDEVGPPQTPPQGAGFTKPMEPVVLREIVKEVVAEFPETLPVRGSVPDDMVVRGNRELLGSIFRNLIQNANAYSGGTEIVVNARRDEGARVTVTVEDDGVGVPDEHLERIFERFYRIDKGRSRALGGTGLGLAIVRGAVAAHGGTIRASRRHPHGLRLTFTLPLN